MLPEVLAQYGALPVGRGGCWRSAMLREGRQLRGGTSLAGAKEDKALCGGFNRTKKMDKLG